MSITILDHALASHLVTRLRDRETAPQEFRRLTQAVTRILVAEATRSLPTRAITISTPLEEFEGRALAETLVVVPVLRAGLGMLEPTLELLPEATVGYVGLQRDEATAIASSYYCKLPDMEGRTALVLDPMLATGGSAAWTVARLADAGARKVLLLCIVAAPEGASYLQAHFPGLEIVTAALDRELNDRKYILPGLGDFGDRLFGTF